MKAIIRKHTPRAVWMGLAKTQHWVLDSVDSALGLQKEMIPPRRLRGFTALSYYRTACLLPFFVIWLNQIASKPSPSLERSLIG